MYEVWRGILTTLELSAFHKICEHAHAHVSLLFSLVSCIFVMFQRSMYILYTMEHHLFRCSCVYTAWRVHFVHFSHVNIIRIKSTLHTKRTRTTNQNHKIIDGIQWNRNEWWIIISSFRSFYTATHPSSIIELQFFSSFGLLKKQSK